MRMHNEIVKEQIQQLTGILDEFRLRRHLLGRDGRDLLERLERRLTETEHRLRRGGARRAEVARVIHDIHEALGRLRERASSKEALS